MTLFKRVFDSHFNEDEAHSAEDERLSSAHDTSQPEDSRFARAVEGVQEEGTAEDARSILSRLDSYEEPEEPKRQPTAAERAAQLHAQMTQPRQQTVMPEQARTPAPTAPLSVVAEPDQIAPIYPEPTPQALSASAPEPVDDAAQSPRSRGRVKTRLLGFHQAAATNTDPFQDPDAKAAGQEGLFPTGWLVVTDGPGAGNALPIYSGVSTLGRGDDQALKLDFGDTSISRQNHAAIAYDGEQNKFFVGHGGKSNIIRLNDKPVLSTEDLSHGDILRIGETTLRFVALCGADFKWTGPEHDAA